MAFFEGGIILSSKDREWYEYDQSDSQQTHTLARLPVANPPPTPYPFLSVGFLTIEIGLAIDHDLAQKQVGVKVTLTPGLGSFTSSIGPWGNGWMFGNNCTWFASPRSLSVAGTESVNRFTVWEHDTEDTDFWDICVTFPKDRFQAAPTVVVWIAGFQIDHTNNIPYEFGGSALLPTKDNFILRFHKGLTTDVKQAQLSWCAFEGGDQIRGGVETLKTIPPPLENKKTRYAPPTDISVPALRNRGGVEQVPKLLQAFSKFKLQSRPPAQGFRLHLDDPELIGEMWRIRVGSWYLSIVDSVEIGWIAFAPDA